MSNSAKKIMIRVISNRMKKGEGFEDIIADYPRLTEEEKKELEDVLKDK